MLPLEGITVVALEQAVAAPFATRQLADLGARVIKVERAGSGDFARGHDETVGGMSSYFVWLNRGKESLVLDIKDEADLLGTDLHVAMRDAQREPAAAQPLTLDEGAPTLAVHSYGCRTGRRARTDSHELRSSGNPPCQESPRRG